MRVNVFFSSIFFMVCGPLFSQTTTSFDFYSEILGEKRHIRLHLPASYNSNDARLYPLIVALDGEYMFYSLLGAAEPLRFRELIPEVIIAGIDQNMENKDGGTARWTDCHYASTTGELEGKGLKFKSFIQHELVPYISQNYHAGSFRAIAGHSFTAHFIHYFLGDDVFKGFIAVSPYIPATRENAITSALSSLHAPLYYFSATADGDLSGHRSRMRQLDSSLFSTSMSSYFAYSFQAYTGENHMSLPVRAASDALLWIFSGYVPLYALPAQDKLDTNIHPVAFLEQRYQMMEKTYGISISYRLDDILTLGWMAQEHAQWEEVQNLGEMAVLYYPDVADGYYLLGSAAEQKNDLKKALQFYKAGYARLGDDILNKEDFYADIERVEGLLNKKNEH